jgi:N-methylhydantoinase A
VEARFDEIEQEARAWLSEQHIDESADIAGMHLVRSADMRYRGQSFELTVPVPDDLSTPAGIEQLLDGFHQYYEQIYGHSDRLAETEIISARVQIVGQTIKPTLASTGVDSGSTPNSPKPVGIRTVRLATPAWEAPVYERDDLRPGMAIDGPCIIEQYDSTILVTPGFQLEVDGQRNVIGSRSD